MLRSLITALVVLLLAAPGAQAQVTRCFGPEKAWCAWTIREDQPDDGWKVAYKAATGANTVDVIIDSPGNRPRLGVRMAPATDKDTAQVIISLRPDGSRPDKWMQFVGRMRDGEQGALRLALGRRALESVLQAPASATLYVFVEFRTPAASRKDSYKIPLTGLNEALRFARLGR